MPSSLGCAASSAFTERDVEELVSNKTDKCVKGAISAHSDKY